jgi:U6 snRNA-associated Sm-like protein LSm6
LLLNYTITMNIKVNNIIENIFIHVKNFHFTFKIGILICLDGTMNVYLQQCEEYVNGKITNRFAEIFIRGNNGKKIYENFIKKFFI